METPVASAADDLVAFADVPTASAHRDGLPAAAAPSPTPATAALDPTLPIALTLVAVAFAAVAGVGAWRRRSGG